MADVIVLAVLAGPAASCGGDAEYFGAWHVMGYGLLLDRVYVPGDDFSVDEELEFAPGVLAYSAEADFSLWYVAVAGAGGAADSGVR